MKIMEWLIDKNIHVVWCLPGGDVDAHYRYSTFHWKTVNTWQIFASFHLPDKYAYWADYSVYPSHYEIVISTQYCPEYLVHLSES